MILTKAKREDETHKIVGAFINWSVFELPGLDLDDVVVPIREFDDLPTQVEIDEMKLEMADSLESLVAKDDLTEDEASSLIESINEFHVSPKELSDKLIGNFSFSNEQGGTYFYISPVDETLNHDIDGDKDNDEATKIEKMLVGFTNTMTPEHPVPLIDMAFRDYRGDDGTYYDILDKEQFFTPEDFELADHHFQGTFDDHGQFLA